MPANFRGTESFSEEGAAEWNRYVRGRRREQYYFSPRRAVIELKLSGRQLSIMNGVGVELLMIGELVRDCQGFYLK